MGTFGTAIFSDDLAMDIRDDFKDKIAHKKSPEETTQELIVEYKEALDDEEESLVFWIALSAIQWKTGRLQEIVKQKAIEIIDSEKDLERWEDDKKMYTQRKVVLEKLKTQLNTPQPAPKKIPIPFVSNTKFEKGDLVSYNHKNGKKIIFRVLEIAEEYSGSRYPKIEILDFFDTTLPDKSVIKKLCKKVAENDFDIFFKHSGTYNIVESGKRDQEPWEKLEIIEKHTALNNEQIGSVSLIWWKGFDDFIDNMFVEKP